MRRAKGAANVQRLAEAANPVEDCLAAIERRIARIKKQRA